jgi:hypothetical protein
MTLMGQLKFNKILEKEKMGVIWSDSNKKNISSHIGSP